ncbi:MAG TPA: hypothetical protein VD902_08455 [Symbiobacteriaceae bacterium]|nr:hypothetical protein [Symbiobacteriaceae bacterium]
MRDKLEITLKITLDRPELERKLKRSLENDTAFFILGMVHAQLTSTFGDEHCQVEMQGATGVNPALIQAMNSFPRRHKRALDALDQWGEAIIEDQDVLEVFQTLHDVVITPLGGKWRVTRTLPLYPDSGDERSKAPKN